MKTYMRRTRIIFAVVILFSILLTVLSIFLPMQNEIEMNTLTYFNLFAETKAHAFNEAINKNIQASKSLSSRSAIRDKSVDYLNGTITFDELVDFTTSKYLDGVGVIENLLYAVRVVDHQAVVEYYAAASVVSNLPDYSAYTELTGFYSMDGAVESFEVISPIISGNMIVGYDLVGFSLARPVAALNNDPTVHFALSPAREYGDRLKPFDNLYEDGTTVYYSQPVNESYDIVVSESKASLFSELQALTIRSITFLIIGYLAMLLLIYLFVVSYARRKISDLSLARDKFKKHADIDELTGAYSRHFLSNYINAHPNESGTLIIIDLDNFKMINDEYGHVVGDAVLKTTASIIQNSIRSDDLSIRYGGDEFLIILRQDTQNNGTDVMDRIKIQLSSQNQFAFSIDFSYGIAVFDSMLNISSYIEQADKLMYQNKHKKY